MSETIVITLMTMFMAGPLVSLNGSPMVSPTTAALWASRALAAEGAGLDELLGVVPGTAGVRHEDGEQEAGDERTGEEATEGLDAMKPMMSGRATARRPG